MTKGFTILPLIIIITILILVAVVGGSVYLGKKAYTDYTAKEIYSTLVT